MITSPHNEQLKTIRKLQDKKHRERSGLFAAEGEDLVEAAEAAGWEPELLLVAGVDVEPALLDAVSALGSGTRVVGVYRQRWAAPGGALSRLPARRARPGQRGRGHPLGARPLRRAGHARPRLCRPLLAEGRARQHGLPVRPAARARGVRGAGRHDDRARARGRHAAGSEVSHPMRPWWSAWGPSATACRRSWPTAASARAEIPLRADGPDSLNVAMAATVALYELAQ